MKPKRNQQRHGSWFRTRSVIFGFMGGVFILAVMMPPVLSSLHHGSEALWRVVQRCGTTPDHKPCTVYDPEKGYVLYKVRAGKGQYLLLPTRRLHGIEEEALLKADTPDYLQAAWNHRALVSRAYGRTIPDERLSLAINSRTIRSQEQLHIHIDCLRTDVRQIVTGLAGKGEQGDVMLRGHPYHWWLLPVLTPAPFLSVPFFPEGADSQERGYYGLVIARLNGHFLLLRSRAHGLNWAFTEELQDHRCGL